MNDHYPFELMCLPYPYEGLCPQLDAQTLYLHHDKHHRAYVEKLNALLAPYPAFYDWSLEQLITHAGRLPEEIRRPVQQQAGGVYNHNLYWHSLAPQGQPLPPGDFADAISRAFGSPEGMLEKMQELGGALVGSGWIWLVADRQGALSLVVTPNQDTPLAQGVCPILVVDLWEHAYYLCYQNRRKDYIEHVFCLLNWQRAVENYQYCLRWAAMPQPREQRPAPRRPRPGPMGFRR